MAPSHAEVSVPYVCMNVCFYVCICLYVWDNYCWSRICIQFVLVLAVYPLYLGKHVQKQMCMHTFKDTQISKTRK